MPLNQKSKGLENSPAICLPADAPLAPEAGQSQTVTPLVALPVEEEGHNQAAATSAEGGKSSVAMQIVTDNLHFKFDTVVDQSQQSVELAAKLELALALLDRSESKLANAMTEIGQLQAHLEMQTQMQEAMQKQMAQTQAQINQLDSKSNER